MHLYEKTEARQGSESLGDTGKCDLSACMLQQGRLGGQQPSAAQREVFHTLILLAPYPWVPGASEYTSSEKLNGRSRITR